MSERLLTARELGDHLGFAAGTIVDWFEAGQIPGFKLGGRLRFRLSEVETWLEQHRGKADTGPRTVRNPDRVRRPGTVSLRTEPD